MEEDRRSSAIDVGSLRKTLFGGPDGINVLNLVPGKSPTFKKRSKSSGQVLEIKLSSKPPNDETQTFFIQNGESCDKHLKKKISVSDSNLVNPQVENEQSDGELLKSACKRRIKRKGARPPSRAFVKSLCLLDSEANLLQESLNDMIIENKDPTKVPSITVTKGDINVKNSDNVLVNDKIKDDSSHLIENKKSISQEKPESVGSEIETIPKDTKRKEYISSNVKPTGHDENPAKDAKQSSLQRAKNILQVNSSNKLKTKKFTDDLYMSKASLRRKAENKEPFESPNILRRTTNDTSSRKYSNSNKDFISSNRYNTELSKRKVSANLSAEFSPSLSSRLRDRFKPKHNVELKEPSSPRLRDSRSTGSSFLTTSTFSTSRGSPRLPGRIFARSKK